ncbi:TPA: response regulator [Pseudomonas aeruginosa]
MCKVRIVIADDHPIVLMGLRDLIETDMRYEVVGEACSPSELIDECERWKPDVIITDYIMPGDQALGDGACLIELLKRRYPDVKLIVHTMLSGVPIFRFLYGLGVSGIVPKCNGLDEVLTAIEMVSQGMIHCNDGEFLSGCPTVKVDEDLSRVVSLSVREYEVLRHFVSGLGVSRIAILLNRSNKTVSTQKISAMRKLNVKTDQELMVLCLKLNLFQ